MIIITDMKVQDANKAIVEVYADALSEITNVTSQGSIVFQGGSIAYDKTGALAILDSTGTWNTVQ